MNIAFKLAWRNLVGAGLRTLLSVFVLSLSYVFIIWQNGLLDGWDQQALNDMYAWEVADGQFWQRNYDPYDVFSLLESRAPLPDSLKKAQSQHAAPILIVQASIYPQGRMQNAILKGIDPEQQVLELPTAKLKADTNEIPVLIGTRMAKNANLKLHESFVIRWRDANGTFDAADARVAAIMKTNVSTIDQGQLWLPLERLQKMMQLPVQATIIAVKKAALSGKNYDEWVFKNRAFLTKDHRAMIDMKKTSGLIMYAILLSLALLVIFDTQVLSIFRRRKEIGTLIALGMTRSAVVRLFTVEGAMHGILALLLASLYGIPLLAYSAHQVFAMPEMADSYGMAIAETIFPVYGAGLVVSTTFIIMVCVTIVSFIPARKIAQMNPTDAIKGKIS